MTSAAASPDADRLQRLAAYLEQDPKNAALLADACDAAIACGRHEQAQAYIVRGEAGDADAAAWLFRRSRIAIARRELPQASELLERLRNTAGDQPVLAHDLAYVRLLQGEFESCRATVQPWLEREQAGEHRASLQVLWLRAMHRLGRGDEALEWARARVAAGTLEPAARGPASLIALDLEDFVLARDWADRALAADPRQAEALVARGCVALATGDPQQARQWLQAALECNPDDGRTWSALGMASLQAQDLPLAESQLERAVSGMPGHVGSAHALGWSRLLQGKHEGALAAFLHALEIDRNFAETHGAIGLVLALRGDAEGSRRHLELADRLDAANVTGRYARALLAGEAGDRAALQRLARRLLDRPGFFGSTLGEAVASHTQNRA